MRHGKKRLQFNRFTSWRKATLKSLLRSLLLYQSIKTTKVKALAVKPLADKLITLAKKNTLTGKRQAFRILGDHRLVSLLFNDIAARFTNKPSGYTRILNLGKRRGDNAEIAILELTEIKKREIKRHKKEANQTREIQPETAKREEPQEKKPKTEDTGFKEKPYIPKKELPKKFLGGLRNIFKKERDSL